MEHPWTINTASDDIRTVAARHGCKILQLYEYDANVYRYNASSVQFGSVLFHTYSVIQYKIKNTLLTSYNRIHNNKENNTI